MRAFPIPEKFPAFKNLDTPYKIQALIDELKINFEDKHPTLRSPFVVLERGEAHCVEGAMLAAAALWYHGEEPLLLDLMTTKNDHGHVIALFRRGGKWGAISKTNHAVLRYRDPVYRDPREIAMSYFNEYFLNDGQKTMRSFSAPFNMSHLGDDWLTSRKNLWTVTDALDKTPHSRIVAPSGERYLSLAHPLEIKAGKLVEWKRRSTRRRTRA